MARLYEDYEVQLLIDCINAQINEESEVKVFREIDWGRLYSIAKIHKVANCLYTTTIRIRGEEIERFRNRFDREYRRAYQLNEKYSNLEKKLFKNLESMQTHCLILSETILRKCYEKQEHRTPWDLEIYVENKSIEKIKEMMVEMGFSENPMEVEDEGLRFVNEDGLNVLFITTFRFSGKEMNKFFSVPPKKFPCVPKHEYVHQHSLTDFYIFYIARLSEKFINGEVKFRDIEDLWVLYLLCYDTMDWPFIYQEFNRFQIGTFAELIIKLAAKWFGDQDFEEHGEQIELMEAYIASDGALFAKENCKILPFESMKKEREQQEHQKKVKDLFPEMNQDEAIYPKVRANKILKWYFWISKCIEERNHKIKMKMIRVINKMHGTIVDKLVEPIGKHHREMAQKYLLNKHKRKLERVLFLEKRMYEKEQSLYEKMVLKDKERELKWQLLDVKNLQEIEKEEYRIKKDDFEEREGITNGDKFREKVKKITSRIKNKLNKKYL